VISLLARSEPSEEMCSGGNDRCLYGSEELIRRNEGNLEARLGVDSGRKRFWPLPSLVSSSMVNVVLRFAPK
jgi:hypothetical protein